MSQTDYKKLLEDNLAIIGWKLNSCGRYHYRIEDNKGEYSGLIFYDESVSLEGRSGNMSIAFYLKDCTIEILGDNETVCIKGKTDESVFILMHNFKGLTHAK